MRHDTTMLQPRDKNDTSGWVRVHNYPDERRGNRKERRAEDARGRKEERRLRKWVDRRT